MNDHLDRAIRAGEEGARDGALPGEHWTRAWMKGAIRSLLEDADPGDLANYHPAAVIGWRAAIAEIRRRAGLEEST